MTEVTLPTTDGGLEEFTLGDPRAFPAASAGDWPRVAYSAAHVVCDPIKTKDPWLDAEIDWPTTLAYREYLWSLGLGVAEAMDTAQRGMGLDWPTSLELIRRTVDAANGYDGRALLACGVGTDHLAPAPNQTIDDIVAAYEMQIEAVEAAGADRLIIMASRALAAAARGPDDYAAVYDRVLSQVAAPVILHWLGEMFDPALTGYWGADDHHAAMDTCLDVIADNAAKVDGIKVSLLSKEKEITMRRRLPADVRMYTGDDFNYAELIAGDDQGYSDALLGIFDPIAPAAAAAFDALAVGDAAAFHDYLGPTVPLSRKIFEAPTRFYKTGVVFLAYLNGFQDHFTMVGGQESARSLLHFADLFRLADQAGLLRDPARAAGRMRGLLALRGIGD